MQPLLRAHISVAPYARRVAGHATLDILQIRTPILEESKSNDISFGYMKVCTLYYTISFTPIPKNKHPKMSV